MMAGYERRLYRSRKGEIFGVCQGIADWRDLPVGSIRLAVILLAVFTGFAPVLVIYLLAAFILPPEPTGYDSRRTSRKPTAEDLKEEFDNLKSKVSGMEDRVFREQQDKEKAWEERFRKN